MGAKGLIPTLENLIMRLIELENGVIIFNNSVIFYDLANFNRGSIFPLSAS